MTSQLCNEAYIRDFLHDLYGRSAPQGADYQKHNFRYRHNDAKASSHHYLWRSRQRSAQSGVAS